MKSTYFLVFMVLLLVYILAHHTPLIGILLILMMGFTAEDHRRFVSSYYSKFRHPKDGSKGMDEITYKNISYTKLTYLPMLFMIPLYLMLL